MGDFNKMNMFFVRWIASSYLLYDLFEYATRKKEPKSNFIL